MVRSAIVVAAMFACGAAACSSPGKKACGSTDAGIIEVHLEAPAGCPPAEANELGIGKPCTMCGNECEAPLRCTCDPYLGMQLSGVPCVCTKIQVAPTGSTDPCGAVPANFCGSGTSCCPVLNSAAYCVPDVCLINGACIEFTPLDAGTDAADAAASD
jgi:hypothetical protein